MNWTGGRLSRHSGTSNPVKDRQKQHFAKVQQALRSGPKQHSPIKWSYPGHDPFNQHESSAAKHTAQLHEHREREARRHHQRHTAARDSTEESCSRRSSQSLELPLRQHVSVKQQPIRIPDDDLYSATPPLLRTKRKREDLTTGAELEHVADRGEAESLSEKRRKFLGKGDWVGVSIQRPLQVTFVSPRKEENIGRRRKVIDGHRARYSSKQQHITSLFPARKQVLAHQISSQESQHERKPPRTDVRISIGGRVVPPGVSSSSAPRRLGSHPTTAHKRSQTTSSDVMLLDGNASITHGSPLVAKNNFATARNSSFGNQLGLYGQGFSPNGTDPRRQIELAHHTPYEHRYIGSGWAGETELEVLQQNQDLINHQRHIELSPKHDGDSATPASTKNNTRPGRLIFSSSTASIHHPAPQNSRVSALLRSASSDIAESTMGQVGKDKPIIPSSHILENEIWETWIAPEQDYEPSLDDPDFSGHGRNRHLSISPGVSAYHAHWHPNSVTDEENDERSLGLEGQDLEEAASTSPRSRSSVPVSGNLDELMIPSPELAQQETKNVEEGLPKVITPKIPEIAFFEGDHNESWMKFLFGGIGDELNATTPSPKTNAMPPRKAEVFGTSILAQASGTEPTISDPEQHLRGLFSFAASSSNSRGTSRVTEASPCPLGSRFRQPHVEMASAIDSTLESSGISIQDDQESILAPISSLISASLAVQAPSQSSDSGVVEVAKLYRSQGRKITFTRPKPFVGRKANLETTVQNEPLRIGRSLMTESESSRSMRARPRDGRDLVESEDLDEREDVESIEDD